VGLTPSPKDDARVAARLLAADPSLGGIWLRGGGDGLVDEIIAIVSAQRPCRKVPLSIDEDRLIGGLDIAATLAAGRPVHSAGLLDEARGGVLIIARAERIPIGLAGRIGATMDEGGLNLLLFDDGGEDERPPLCLTERLAFHLDLGVMPADEADRSGGTPALAVTTTAAMQALASASAALGVASARADLFALRAARGHSALRGGESLAQEDLAFAGRTILARRATRLPPPPEEPDTESADEQPSRREELEDSIVEAARAMLPGGLLAALLTGGRAGRGSHGHGAGGEHISMLRGRPIAGRRGLPRGGARLALLDTLRSAAPWQKSRGRTDRLRLHRDDLRVRRFRARSASLTVFAVDASGSAAAARLAEAKGAVELLLQQGYARRAEVALVAFRKEGAELLLPPTRSLTRARRLLAALPGGGGTPLAAGIDAARHVAEAAAARGRTPAIIMLTDGRANIAADGSQDRAAASADSAAAARRVAHAGIAAMVIDIGARPQPEAARLSQAMVARYLHLPRADAAVLCSALTE
jgi:magnesium chelatase subunit D